MDNIEIRDALAIIEEVLTNTPKSHCTFSFDYRKVRWTVIFNSPFPSDQIIVIGVKFGSLNDAIIEMARQTDRENKHG